MLRSHQGSSRPTQSRNNHDRVSVRSVYGAHLRSWSAVDIEWPPTHLTVDKISSRVRYNTFYALFVVKVVFFWRWCAWIFQQLKNTNLCQWLGLFLAAFLIFGHFWHRLCVFHRSHRPIVILHIVCGHPLAFAATNAFVLLLLFRLLYQIDFWWSAFAAFV